jgi:hypothetical protein
MATENYPAASQSNSSLAASAGLADRAGPPIAAAAPAGAATPNLAARASQLRNCDGRATATPSCQQGITLAYFFDGTGNNLEADSPGGELSNVAKMYLAHQRDQPELGIYRFYIPGIGTRFEEVGDPGGTTRGLGFGDKGQDRLDWAFQKFDETLRHHVALAQNPTNKISMIRISAFGFSRGATLARAFARDFQRRCTKQGAVWVLTEGQYPVRFHFLGVWDTVASVGVPMSANNTPGAQSLGWMGVQRAMRNRNMTSNGVRVLAFGQPGADPAPGPADGHGAWADGLDVVDMVEKCIHMVAAHEIRNSFPLDSARRNNRYPDNVQEMVYPGVHSDLGGGYRPGEGARSHLPGQMLSLIPLRAMHSFAWDAGVKISPLNALPTQFVTDLFAADQSSQAEFNKLSEHWRYYMGKAGFGGRGVGQMFNSHMALYYGWRFYRIRQNQASRAGGQPTADQARLNQSERQWRPERQQLQQQMDADEAAMNQADRAMLRATELDRMDEQSHMYYGYPRNAALQAQAQAARLAAQAARSRYLATKARFDTLPTTDGQVGQNLNIYDDQLIADALAIRAHLTANPELQLRPHYRGLMDAYEAEFVRGQGLRDDKIIHFFDTYVHDSLAGFARDATLPSDPRVIYIGGDAKSQHANIMLPGQNQRQGVPA